MRYLLIFLLLFSSVTLANELKLVGIWDNIFVLKDKNHTYHVQQGEYIGDYNLFISKVNLNSNPSQVKVFLSDETQLEWNYEIPSENAENTEEIPDDTQSIEKETPKQNSKINKLLDKIERNLPKEMDNINDDQQQTIETSNQAAKEQQQETGTDAINPDENSSDGEPADSSSFSAD